jgi:hypothetical protein
MGGSGHSTTLWKFEKTVTLDASRLERHWKAEKYKCAATCGILTDGKDLTYKGHDRRKKTALIFYYLVQYILAITRIAKEKQRQTMEDVLSTDGTSTLPH